MRHGKVDVNQTDIVTALRAIGCSVEILSDVGRGCPDLLVGIGYPGGAPRNYLLEVKGPRGRLTPDQVKWHDAWRGQYAVVRTPEEAIAVVTFSAGRAGRPKGVKNEVKE